METDRLLNDKVLKEAFELKKKNWNEDDKSLSERREATSDGILSASDLNLCVCVHVLPLSMCVCGDISEFVIQSSSQQGALWQQFAHRFLYNGICLFITFIKLKLEIEDKRERGDGKGGIQCRGPAALLGCVQQWGVDSHGTE